MLFGGSFSSDVIWRVVCSDVIQQVASSLTLLGGSPFSGVILPGYPCVTLSVVAPTGRHLVVFRTRSGEARVLDGICPHLGADLAQGAVQGDDIECPFHKWLFNGETGAVECVPYTKQSKSKDSFALSVFVKPLCHEYLGN